MKIVMRTFTLLISDLHLHQEDPVVTTRFMQFMRDIAPSADALYILGDLFEAWIGDDDMTPFNQQISQKLKALADSGVPIYFMRGNRDFVLGKRFAKQSGFKMLADPCVINLYGKPVLLSHGDVFCTLDIRHQKYRKFILNPFWQKLLLIVMPLFVRRKIAARMRENSGKYHHAEATHIMDVTPDAIRDCMQENNVNLMIHGHTHRPNIHKLTVNDEAAERVVMGAWHDHADYVKFYSDGEYELVPFE